MNVTTNFYNPGFIKTDGFAFTRLIAAQIEFIGPG